jgi:hypothetical protein
MARKRKSPTAKQRRKYGMKGPGKQGKFPVYSERTAMSALRLRGRGKGVSKKSVVNKVSRWASKTGNTRVKNAVKRARAADRKKT